MSYNRLNEVLEQICKRARKLIGLQENNSCFQCLHRKATRFFLATDIYKVWSAIGYGILTAYYGYRLVYSVWLKTLQGGSTAYIAALVNVSPLAPVIKYGQSPVIFFTIYLLKHMENINVFISSRPTWIHFKPWPL